MSRGRPESAAKKRLTEESLALRIGYFIRERALTPPPGGAYRSTLHWTWTGSGRAAGSLQWTATADQVILRYGDPPADYPIPVVYTPLAGGGRRAWWACPGCDRRCAVLYAPQGQHPFACRVCHRLAYYSQQSRYGSPDPLRQLRNFAVGRRILEEVERRQAGTASPPAALLPRRGRPRTKRKYTRRAPSSG